MQTSTATILIIVGISGDLAKRKVLPAISEMAKAGVLPDQFRIVGITRQTDISINDLLKKTKNRSYIQKHFELFQMNLTHPDDYNRLAAQLQKIESSFGNPAQRLFYLSVPPQVSRPIIELLGSSGLAKAGQTKLLLEKPFGVDLESATDLVKHIDHYFNAEQVYRIDHYLAKETAQNLIIFRDGNSLFKRTWNKDFIESIQIIASEAIGIEGRIIFYEQTGALRDLVQSHLLQLAALTLMELPKADDLRAVSEHRLAALRFLKAPAHSSITDYVKRGQYTNYREEIKNPHSTVETFVSLTLQSTDPHWIGVPITLSTGKSLNAKATEIRIMYKQDDNKEANELILRLQPNEGVELCVWAKRPGYEHQKSQHLLKFSFREHYKKLPDAYEQVLFDAINSDHSLFASSDEVLESWRILDPIQKTWEMSAADLVFYKPGSELNEVLQLK